MRVREAGDLANGAGGELFCRLEPSGFQVQAGDFDLGRRELRTEPQGFGELFQSLVAVVAEIVETPERIADARIGRGSGFSRLERGQGAVQVAGGDLQM